MHLSTRFTWRDSAEALAPSPPPGPRNLEEIVVGIVAAHYTIQNQEVFVSLRNLLRTLCRRRHSPQSSLCCAKRIVNLSCSEVKGLYRTTILSLLSTVNNPLV